MRVLILSSLYPPRMYGGAEKAASQLAEALRAQGDDVAVVTLHPGNEESYEVVNGVRVYRLPMDNFYWPFGRTVKLSPIARLLWHLQDMWNWRAAARVGRILDLEKPDVVNSHLLAGFSVAVWREVKKRGIRLVHTMHDYYLLCPRSDIFKSGRSCAKQCLFCKCITGTRRSAAKHLDAVVSVSQGVLDKHRSWGVLTDVSGKVIYNVATSVAVVKEDIPDADPEVLVFGFIGRVSEAKGIRVLLEATRSLKSAAWLLRIAGSGIQDEVDALKQEFPDPRIEWLGYTDSEIFYQSIHVVVIPSVWSDPLPYVVIESHLHNRPVIYSAAGGIPELAVLGKKSAAFAPKDSAALAGILENAIEEKSEWLKGGFLNEMNRDLFSQKSIVEQYHKQYVAQAKAPAALESMAPIRVVIINTLYPPYMVGGAEKSVALLADALARKGDRVTIVTLHPGKGESFEEVNGLRIYRLPVDNIYWPGAKDYEPNVLLKIIWHLKDISNRKSAARVGRILDIERPDVVHTNVVTGFSIAVWAEARKRKIKIVHTLRDYYMLCVRSTLFLHGKICEKRCKTCQFFTLNQRAHSGEVDAVIANSAYVLNAHTEKGYFRDVHASVIYNIAEPEIRDNLSIRSLESPTLTFGFIGSIVPTKGLDVILEATTKLTPQNWQLRIAGNGPSEYVNQLKYRFPDPRIYWLGRVNSKEFYASIDVTIISSLWAEPLPRTLIESFAAGKSAICAESGGIPEIASLGKVIATYPPADARALATIMEEAIRDPQRWREGGIKDSSALAQFSEPAVVTRYRSVYAEVIQDQESQRS